MSRPLGHVQIAILASLVEHRIWSRRGLGGWLWDTPGNTERVLDSLVKRGFAAQNGNTYIPTAAGKKSIKIQKVKSEIRLLENMNYDQVCDSFGSGYGGDSGFCFEMRDRNLSILRKKLRKLEKTT